MRRCSPTMRALLILALAPLGAQACFGSLRAVRQRYYTLSLGGAADGAPPGAAAHAAPEDGVEPEHPARGTAGLLRVRDIQVAALVDRAQLVVRRSREEVRFCPHDVWAVRPGRMLGDALAQALSSAPCFSGVTRELGELRPDLSLSGTLDALEIEQTPEGDVAHLSLTLQLADAGEGQALWRQTFERRAALPGRAGACAHASAAIAAYDALLRTAVAEARQSMADVLAGRAQPAAAEASAAASPVPTPALR